MQIKQIPLDQIDEPTYDVRILIVQEELDDLAKSIKAVGILQPLRVFKNGDRYEIEDGHRRYLAAKMISLLSAPCYVIESKKKLRELHKLHANIYSKDLTAVEKSRSLHHVMNEFGYTQADLAGLMGVDQSRISQLLGIVNWPSDVREAVEDGKMSEHVGRELQRIKDPAKRKYYGRYVLEGGATLNTVKGWVQHEIAEENAPQPPPPSNLEEPPEIQEVIVKKRCGCCRNDFQPDHLLVLYLCIDCYNDIKRIMPEIYQAIKDERAGKVEKKPSIEPGY